MSINVKFEKIINWSPSRKTGGCLYSNKYGINSFDKSIASNFCYSIYLAKLSKGLFTVSVSICVSE